MGSTLQEHGINNLSYNKIKSLIQSYSEGTLTVIYSEGTLIVTYRVLFIESKHV